MSKDKDMKVSNIPTFKSRRVKERSMGLLKNRKPDDIARCPQCQSKSTEVISTPEFEALFGFIEYECLLCGCQWHELKDLDEPEPEKKARAR